MGRPHEGVATGVLAAKHIPTNTHASFGPADPALAAPPWRSPRAAMRCPLPGVRCGHSDGPASSLPHSEYL